MPTVGVGPSDDFLLFIHVSSRAVVSAFQPFYPVDTVLLFAVFTVSYLC